MHLTHGLHCAKRSRPRHIAVSCGDRHLDWTTLVDRIARLASVFRGIGLEPGGRVAILLTSGPGYVECLYAAMWAGGVAVPVNSRFALPEMIGQLQDAEPTVLVVDDAFADRAKALEAAVPSLLGVLDAERYEAAIAAASPEPDAMRGANDVACLFYTGGTTGRSKGVMLSHANIWANAMATTPIFGFDENLVHLHAGPLFHLGAASRVFTTTVVGGRHVLLPRFDPASLLATIERHAVTTTSLVPTMMAMILNDPHLAGFTLPGLQVITYGAAPIQPAMLRRVIARFPGVRLFQSYGMTELSPVATVLDAADHAPDAPQHRLQSAGRPLMTAEVRVASPDGADRSPGHIGEILVRGPMVMLGYWQQPELTATVLRDGWMHTGDLGFLDADGYLTVVDRLKDMIITGGENVYCTEVENALASHQAIAQCAVFGVADPHWGERVHAVVVLASGQAVAASELEAHCRNLIAGYKLPRSYDFRTESLPLSSVNKVDKIWLRAALALA